MSLEFPPDHVVANFPGPILGIHVIGLVQRLIAEAEDFTHYGDEIKSVRCHPGDPAYIIGRSALAAANDFCVGGSMKDPVIRVRVPYEEVVIIWHDWERDHRRTQGKDSRFHDLILAALNKFKAQLEERAELAYADKTYPELLAP